jgi:hypothetical protein
VPRQRLVAATALASVRVCSRTRAVARWNLPFGYGPPEH